MRNFAFIWVRHVGVLSRNEQRQVSGNTHMLWFSQIEITLHTTHYRGHRKTAASHSMSLYLSGFQGVLVSYKQYSICTISVSDQARASLCILLMLSICEKAYSDSKVRDSRRKCHIFLSRNRSFGCVGGTSICRLEVSTANCRHLCRRSGHADCTFPVARYIIHPRYRESTIQLRMRQNSWLYRRKGCGSRSLRTQGSLQAHISHLSKLTAALLSHNQKN